MTHKRRFVTCFPSQAVADLAPAENANLDRLDGVAVQCGPFRHGGVAQRKTEPFKICPQGTKPAFWSVFREAIFSKP
jgi:hypothetical protein